MFATTRLLGRARTATRARTARRPGSSMRRLMRGTLDPARIGVRTRRIVTRGRVTRALRSLAPYCAPPAGLVAVGVLVLGRLASALAPPPVAVGFAGAVAPPPASMPPVAATADSVHVSASANSARRTTRRGRRIHPRVGHRPPRLKGSSGQVQVPRLNAVQSCAGLSVLARTGVHSNRRDTPLFGASVAKMRINGVTLRVAATLLMAAIPASAARAAAPPGATFTPNVRADAAETTKNQNEPQVVVDQAGTTFVTWQAGQKCSDVSKTSDGQTFTYLGYPDPQVSSCGLGTGDVGDVTMAHGSYADALANRGVDGSGNNPIIWGDLANGGQSCPGAIEIRNAITLDGTNWLQQATAGCQPAQIDRPWVAAYTPPQYRGTDAAFSHTSVYYQYHDFGVSNVWVEPSTDGGQTWASSPDSAVQPGSPQQGTSTCNTIPGGVAVTQNGAHAGRVYAVWSTSDLNENTTQGCNYSQAEAFDHVFLSYSDDGGQTWTSSTVFNDPCAPQPPAPPMDPTSCQDVSELFTSAPPEHGGNSYAAYIRRDASQAPPEYDVYVATSRDGGQTFTTHRAKTDTGTHYMPWVAAAGDGGVDVGYYDTPVVAGVGQFNKPAAAPSTAQWTVQLSQSLDGGTTWTQNQVSDHAVYFGDICSTGIFCGNGSAFGWGDDRILFDDFGVAVGPDGGARVAWTDARDSWTGSCQPGGTVSCQTTHIRFACQDSGVGLSGQTITGCGASTPATGGAGTTGSKGTGGGATGSGPSSSGGSSRRCKS